VSPLLYFFRAVFRSREIGITVRSDRRFLGQENAVRGQPTGAIALFFMGQKGLPKSEQRTCATPRAQC
jgi:hypothetical protein